MKRPHQQDLPKAPINGDMPVDVLFRNGVEDRGRPAKQWHFGGFPHGAGAWDIVKWQPAA